MARIPRTATVAISAVTALAWLITVLFVPPGAAEIGLGFIPIRVGFPAATIDGMWTAPALLTPLTATLVHSGPVHIGFNLLIFVWCGSQVERILGRGPLILIYLVGAYASAAGQWLADPASAVPMIGASGAISAVIGAFALSFGRAKMITRSARLNRWINIVWLLAAWVVLQVLVGWTAGSQGYLLATPAHIGGFLAGLLMQRPLLLWKYRRA